MRKRELQERLTAMLPQWFGQPKSNARYAMQAEVLEGYIAETEGVGRGLLLLKYISPLSAEVYWMGVDPTCHRSGIGGALIRKRQLRPLASAECATFSWLLCIPTIQTNPTFGHDGSTRPWASCRPRRAFPDRSRESHRPLLEAAVIFSRSGLDGPAEGPAQRTPAAERPGSTRLGIAGGGGRRRSSSARRG